MNDTNELVITEPYQAAQHKWTSLLAMSENVCVIFPYLSDRQFRLFQWSESLKDTSIQPLLLNFSMRSFDELNDFEQYLNELLPKEWQQDTLKNSLARIDKKIAFIVIDGESLLEPQNSRMMYFLQRLLISYSGKIASLIAFESNVYQRVTAINDFNKLFQNILYYPLYSDQDVSQFIRYLCAKWQLKMASPIRKSIIKASGGYFWLAKEACRSYRDSGTWNPDAQSFQYRIASIANALSPTEVMILSALPHMHIYENTKEYQHLANTGLIYDRNKLRTPILLPHLHTLAQPTQLLELRGREILLRGVSLSHVLSQTEYALLGLFLTKPNTPLTRDEIAEIIWPNQTEDHYSQWAIDQAVKRLRDRLVSLQLPPTIISSVRGIGYEYRA